jgi:hypothetical protein
LGVPRAPDAVLVDSDRYVALDVQRLPKADVPPDRLPRVGARATAATTGLAACSATPDYNLEFIAESSTPFARRPVTIPLAGEFLVVGWAVDTPNHRLAADVDVVVDERPFPAFYGIDRPDVAEYLGVPDYRASGFTARLPGADAGRGEHTISIRILSADRRCYYAGARIPVVAR